MALRRPITVNGTPQDHNFHVAGDQDWVKFSASAGQVYTITTSSLGAANDTELKLYDKNGTTQLEYNDDCASLESCIKKWVAPSSGTYYVQVYGFAGKGGCPGYQYTLAVTGTSNSTSSAKAIRPVDLGLDGQHARSWPGPIAIHHRACLQGRALASDHRDARAVAADGHCRARY